RAVIVGLPVTGIAVLIGEEIALRLPLGQAMHLAQRLVIALQRIRRDELGAVRDNALAPFKASILRYHQVYRVLYHGTEHGIGDTGVARAGIQDDLART